MSNLKYFIFKNYASFPLHSRIHLPDYEYVLSLIRSHMKKGYGMGRKFFPFISLMAFITMGSASAFAAGGTGSSKADLLVRVGWVQCGPYEQLDYACAYDQRCCELKEFEDGEIVIAPDVPDGQGLLELIRNEEGIIVDVGEMVVLQ